ncbi:cysteine desulfurase family protein [Chloroflexota bacterium]
MADMKRKVYLDNVATMPVDSRVVEAMLPFFGDTFGNPVSIHHWGEQSSDAVELARFQVASLINARPDEIVFTSGGTESNNLAIKGLAREHSHRGHHMITSAVEHFSVLHSFRSLEKDGFEVTYLPVDEYGMVSLKDVARNLREDTILVSIMHANNEVGTIQAIGKIADIVRDHGAFFHTDAIATVGTIVVDVQKLGVDALSLAGNQFYGPQGTGALWLRPDTAIAPLLEGGVQEMGKRSGTHNVPGIVGLGQSAEIAKQETECRTIRVSLLRDKLIEGISNKINRSVLTGHPQNRLPGHASFCIEFVEGEAMLAFLDSEGIAAASGSACAATISKSSHTLQAMGIPAVLSQGSLIFSLGIQNTEEDILYVLDVLPPIVERLRQISPLYAEYLRG